jgi:secreted trypsin-like serine protease
MFLAESNELIGITSYVKDAENFKDLHENVCDSNEAPAVYLRVASYLNWISEKTGISFD